MDIFFLFLPAVIVLANYLISDMRETPERVPVRMQAQRRCY